MTQCVGGHLISESESRTQELGELLASIVAPGDVIMLSGDLGAGKTQLTKGLAKGLGVIEPVTSPTFNILLVHEGRIPLYHFDLYRLDVPAELEDLDYFGTLESDGVSVVEWGDKFAEAEPEDRLLVAVRITGDASRAIEVEGRGARSARMAAEWLDAAGGEPR